MSKPSKATLTEATGYAGPHALFSCSNKYCQVECSYPADMLYWYEREKRWVCENCWDDLDYENEGEDRPQMGMTLEAYIVQNRLMAAEILHNGGTQRPPTQDL